MQESINIIKIKAKSAFVPTKIPGAKYVINQYVGCQHACKYCYAKFMCKYYPYGEWGSWIVIKENIPNLVKGKLVFGKVYMSTVSDPYQPIEENTRLTRKILENLDKRTYLYILTKSDLVVRDVDLFRIFKNIEVGLTINSWDSKLKNILEPFAHNINRRIEALQTLKENKIDTYCFISPVIPELTDIEWIIKETKDFTDFYLIEILNLKRSGKEFVCWLKDTFSRSYNILTNKNLLLRFVENIKNLSKDVTLKEVILHF